MGETLAEIEISKDGEIYYVKMTLPSGEVVNMENESFEEILEQIANDLEDRYPS
ncbi:MULTISPECIES: hypothetical protein [Acidiplasma]|jgi:hypothetical protein|uniref:hypothetical protein n=1 Tax=Acidiplasma TaxID=507753 RepID=UPI000A7D5F4D|nr:MULTISPECIES: hypothetical protein [Acidiplasma]WMT54752.1 MAG: hypothetical protein RE470_07530 [Acidiplasma sp.]